MLGRKATVLLLIGLFLSLSTLIPGIAQEGTPTSDPNLTPTVEETASQDMTITPTGTEADITEAPTSAETQTTSEATLTVTEATPVETITSTETEVTSETEEATTEITPAPTEAASATLVPTIPPANGNTITGTSLITETLPFSQELLAQLQLPAGFEITAFAQGLGNIRMMAIADDGTIYISRRTEGDVIALFDNNGDGIPDTEGFRVVVENLPIAHGILIRDNVLYIASDTDVFKADILESGTIGELQSIVSDLPDGGQHPNSTIAFGPDGMLYISVGSACNACSETNTEVATILTTQADGTGRTVFASGLRNTIGFGWHPVTGQMWGMDHGTDWRGDNTPPEELNLLTAGAHYGWPYCYGNQQPDVYLPSEPSGSTKEAFCPTTTAPVLEYQAHSAPIGMVFYTGTQFPADYQNDAFVAMRGSWNRSPATGYKLVRVVFDDNGQPTEIQDFVTGWLIEDDTAHFGRIAGVAQAPDGSLFVTDDTNGVLYRITYTGN